jgi:hypothetical protein
MLGRRALAAGGVVFCTTASVLLGAAGPALAARPDAAPSGPSVTSETTLPDPGGQAHDPTVPTEHGPGIHGQPPETTPPPPDTTPVPDDGSGGPVASDGGGGGTVTGDGGGGGVDGSGANGSGGGPVIVVDPTPTDFLSGGHTIGGAPAAAPGAGGAEVLSVSTAPTPPNGAEPAAAGSPGAAVPSGRDDTLGAPALTADPVVVETSGTDAPTLPDFADTAIATTGLFPAVKGLSPDTMGSGGLVAILAFVVSLAVVAHQLVDRRDPRRNAQRVAEAVARFR